MRRPEMCEENNCCEKPEELKGKPQDCSPEQIKKCHGFDPDHPCAKEGKTAE
jgi:hypothetical protein